MQKMKQIRPVDKITALWALTEAGLGGFFHALKMPFTGLIIAGVSVIFLTLIAHLSRGKYRQVISATLVVLIIKMLIAPHTPPTAYFAVLFQGLSAFAIFYLLSIHRLSIALFSILALLESGFQKIVTLTIFYGLSIWESIDSFYDYLNQVLAFLPALSGTQLLFTLYFALYFIGALIFAFMAHGILKGLSEDRQELLMAYRQFVFDRLPESKKKKQRLIGRRTWLIIILFFIVGVLLIFNPDMGWQRAIFVFVRSLVMILLWYIVAAPLFKYLFERFLRKQKKRFTAELEFVLAFFPTLKSIAFFARKRNGRIDKFSKIRQFFQDVIYLTLQSDDLMDKHEKKTMPNSSKLVN
jgi:hypothetical protein